VLLPLITSSLSWPLALHWRGPFKFTVAVSTGTVSSFPARWLLGVEGHCELGVTRTNVFKFALLGKAPGMSISNPVLIMDLVP